MQRSHEEVQAILENHKGHYKVQPVTAKFNEEAGKSGGWAIMAIQVHRYDGVKWDPVEIDWEIEKLRDVRHPSKEDADKDALARAADWLEEYGL